MTQRTPERPSVHPRHVSRCQMLGYFGGKAYGRQCLVKQSWEMGEICPKTKSYPPLTKQKLISTHPHIMTIFRLNPPPPYKKFPPIDSLITSLLVGFLPSVQTSLQMTLQRTSKSHLKSHQNHWTLGLCRLRMNCESCLMELFFEAQFHHIVFYLPYFKFISLLINKVSTVGFFILLNYDAMCANNGIFLFFIE